jgi:hypothetical protein
VLLERLRRGRSASAVLVGVAILTGACGSDVSSSPTAPAEPSSSSRHGRAYRIRRCRTRSGKIRRFYTRVRLTVFIDGQDPYRNTLRLICR